MKNNEKQKNNELIALRFKEVRENFFHCEIIKDGKRSDHTQDDFGEFLGVEGATIRNYEKGKTPIPEKFLRKLANKYDLRIEYLLGEDDFRTLKEKYDAIAKKDYEEKIMIPVKISSLIGDILEIMGYTGFEDDITEKEFFVADFDIPVGYTSHQSIPGKDIIDSFSNTARHIRPQKYRGIKRKKDGKEKYILVSKLNTIFDDIENYIKYRVEREFRQSI